jgi:hypothetical protein
MLILRLKDLNENFQFDYVKGVISYKLDLFVTFNIKYYNKIYYYYTM